MFISWSLLNAETCDRKAVRICPKFVPMYLSLVKIFMDCRNLNSGTASVEDSVETATEAISFDMLIELPISDMLFPCSPASRMS